ncbi:MAG: sigma-70 family RNA polymerase sigma factor [Candidatus Obscuribacterales bacterium]|nr:sigma-70 family RNA polymerase sigma factor [Candidatus Obscuribacterales bacterium]
MKDLSRTNRDNQVGSFYFGEEEINDLVREHMPLVRQIARRYSQCYPDSYEDLTQVGSIGLLKAINYYDPNRTRAASFRTLATCYIRGEIRHYLRDHASIVQVPRKLTEMNAQISQLEERLTKVYSRVPTLKELATHSGFSEKEILEAQQSWEARLHYESLDGSDEDDRDDHRGLSEVVADKKYQELLKMSEDRELLVQALKRLGEKTRQIVEFVFFYDLSQKETACVLGLSEMGVSRAIHSGLKNLKDIIVAETAQKASAEKKSDKKSADDK